MEQVSGTKTGDKLPGRSTPVFDRLGAVYNPKVVFEDLLCSDFLGVCCDQCNLR